MGLTQKEVAHVQLVGFFVVRQEAPNLVLPGENDVGQ